MEAFLFFILGLAASLIINLVTPNVQKWLDSRSLVNKRKRRKALEEELRLITELHSNSSRMTATVAGDFIVVAGLLALPVIAIGTSIVFQVMSYEVPTFPSFGLLGIYTTRPEYLKILSRGFIRISQFCFVAAYLAFLLLLTISFRIFSLTRKVRQFEKYKQEVEARIAQLSEQGAQKEHAQQA